MEIETKRLLLRPFQEEDAEDMLGYLEHPTVNCFMDMALSSLEEARAEDFQREENLRHPYTKALWRAMPRHGFQYIEGSQPYVKNLPKGCIFSPRCSQCQEACRGEIPYREVRGGKVRCLYAQ